jgi:ATP-binding cassette, subfamily F, member 2
MPPKEPKVKREKKVKPSKKNGDGVDVSELGKSLPEDDGRIATGILVSEPRARDIKISQFSLSLYGITLIDDTNIELNHGARYGLVGRNGCGKSTLLKCLAAREVPIPDIFDVYLLTGEAEPSEKTALNYVIDSANEEIVKIDHMIEHIMVTDGPESEALMPLYDRQEELDPSTFEARASTILVGLGFKATEIAGAGGAHIHKQTKDMSGGWRMRVALAKALFLAPAILMLDEPTNHVPPPLPSLSGHLLTPPLPLLPSCVVGS